MPYDMPLPKRLRGLWKVKIQDKEALFEEPHVTIWRKGRRWRFGLRRSVFLDPRPDPGEVPEEVLAEIASRHEELCEVWDRFFAANPVEGEHDDKEDT